MKKESITVLLVLVLITGVKSQIGNYCLDLEFTKTCYEFKEGNRFEFIDFMCVGIVEGKGRFEIENNKIRFIYEPLEFFETRFTIEKNGEKKGKIGINFLVQDYDTKEKIGNYIVCEEKGGHRENEISHNENRIEISYKEDPIFLNISYPNYSNYTFKVTESGEYTVKVFLKHGKEADSYEMKKGIEEYRIIELKEKKITLRDEEYDYQMIFTKD